MPSYEEVFENNKQWIASKSKDNKDFFAQLSKGQNPEYLYIGCSDSRVNAEEMMGAEPGDVFVHRNIANIVSNSDLNVLSVIEYAVKHLHVKHIVVCGHYNCGGVKAAMESKNLGLLNPWLRNVRDVYRLNIEELDEIDDVTLRYERLVELNVKEQCINVAKTGSVQDSYFENGYPLIHGWVFDVNTGNLIDLKIDLIEELKGIFKIYNLTGK
jgi:carbonic anhydrase